MDAEKDGLNEARLPDDRDEQAADNVLNSRRPVNTTAACQHSTSSPSASECTTAHVLSSSCVSNDNDASTANVDDSDPTQDASATPVTSVPLLEQLVSSTCGVVAKNSQINSVVASSAPVGSDRQNGVNKSFLQKLESFVSSVGQVTPASLPLLPHPPFSGWIRQPFFPSRSGGSVASVMPASIRRPGPINVSSHPVASAFLPSPAVSDSNQPLDLSARRLAFAPDHRYARLTQHGSRHDISGSGGRLANTTTDQLNGANSLACLERDFGEHSTILTRLRSSRQRTGVAALLARNNALNRHRQQITEFPGTSLAGSRMCPPETVTTKFCPPRSFFHGDQQQRSMIYRRGSTGEKLDSHRQMPSTAATALRCLQCDQTFYSLPELMLHMMHSSHYANLICAAAAYNAADEDDCLTDDVLVSRRPSNVVVDYSLEKCDEMRLSNGKDDEITDVPPNDNFHHSRTIDRDIWRSSYVDAAVSPARSLDAESVSSAGLTDTDSLRSSTSTGSPISPSYVRSDEHTGSGGREEDFALMSHLLRLQPLSGFGHLDWTALERASTEERRRLLFRERQSRMTVKAPAGQTATELLPIDLRSQRGDAGLGTEDESRPMPSLLPVGRMSALTSRFSSTKYLERLLDNVRECRKSSGVAAKRSTASREFSDKHHAKKYRASNISLDYCKTSNEQPRHNADRLPVTATSVEASLRKETDRFQGSSKPASAAIISPQVNYELNSVQRQTTDCVRRPASDSCQQVVVDSGSSSSNGTLLSVVSRDADTAGDIQRSTVDKDQAEYAARFGKYYRMAQELSSRFD